MSQCLTTDLQREMAKAFAEIQVKDIFWNLLTLQCKTDKEASCNHIGHGYFN